MDVDETTSKEEESKKQRCLRDSIRTKNAPSHLNFQQDPTLFAKNEFSQKRHFKRGEGRFMAMIDLSENTFLGNICKHM